MLLRLPHSIKDLIKYLLKSPPVTEIANQLPATDIQPPATNIMNEPSLSGKFFPYQSATPYYILEKQNPQYEVNSLNLPVPPQHLWENYGETTDEYLADGEKHVCKMKSVLEYDEFRFEPGQRVMDLGCASARMMRWLVDESKHSEIWGVDISAEHIMWCQQNISPPFYFSPNTTEPHLPFSDEYFDLIYAGSVFTHINELADAWFLELKRLLKKGGRIYITVHDNNTIYILKKWLPDFSLTKHLNNFDAQTNVLSSNFAVFSTDRSPHAQVFYDIDYLQKKLSRWYRVKSINENAYGYQTAILLQKD